MEWLPETGPKRDAYVAAVGVDGFRLLDALAGADAPRDAAALPVVGTLRRVWARHFERIEGSRDDGGQDGSGQDGGARSTVNLVNALEQERTANRSGQLADRVLRLDLVILDELGYLPFSSSGGALLF